MFSFVFKERSSARENLEKCLSARNVHLREKRLSAKKRSSARKTL